MEKEQGYEAGLWLSDAMYLRAIADEARPHYANLLRALADRIENTFELATNNPLGLLPPNA